MGDSLNISIAKKLLDEKGIRKELKERRKDVITENVDKEDNYRRDILKNEGWEVATEFKHKVRLQKRKSFDVLFEDKVWSLLASMGFDTMNSDRNFVMPYGRKENEEEKTQQIDVLAKDEDTIIIIECKATSQKNKQSSFKKDLEAYAEKIDGLRTNLRALFSDKKYKIKFILATENYNLSDNDRIRLNNLNGIHLNEEQIEYFIEIQKQIGYAAKYQFLGNVFEGIDIPDMDNKIPAIRGRMGGHTYYSFSIEPEKLLKIGYVLHRNKANINMMPTYQRIIKKNRLRSIHNFIEQEKGYFANSIIISLESKGKKLNFDEAATKTNTSISSIGMLHLPKQYRSAYIIDGQHRLYGYANSQYKNTNSIPVVAFVDLDREEQIKLFMEINENQKAVSKNLRNTLNSDLLWTSDNQIERLTALRSRLAINLGESRKSALFDRISIGEDKREITQQAFEKSLKQTNFFGVVDKTQIKELGTFYGGNVDKSYKDLNYLLEGTFNYIYEAIPEIWNHKDNIIVINKGIYGIIRLLDDIIEHLREEEIISFVPPATSTTDILSKVKPYLDPVIKFFREIDSETEEALRKAYGGNGDIKYWRTLQQQVIKVHKDFNPKGLNEYLKKEAKEYNADSEKIIQKLKLFIKQDIENKLQDKHGDNWYKKALPILTQKKANELAFNKNIEIENEDDEVSEWDCLSISDYRDIILSNWRDVFEKQYVILGLNDSGNKEDKTIWLEKLNKLSKENLQSYSVTEEDFNFLQQLEEGLLNQS